MSKIVIQAILFASGVAMTPGAVHGAGQDKERDKDTTTIKRDSDTGKQMPQPSYQTREERLKAQPLDWNKTSGKPKRKAQTAAERKALESAKGESAEGGAPDPKADAEARRLYPEEWKKHEK